MGDSIGPDSTDSPADGRDATRVTRRLAGAIPESAADCLLRIGREHGRSRDSTALGLERRLRTTAGVFDEDVSSRTGVVREAGVRLRDGSEPSVDTADVERELWSEVRLEAPFVGWYGLTGAIETLRHRAVDIDEVDIDGVFVVRPGDRIPLAVVGHEGSTVIVSLNGLRLLGLRD